MNKFEFWCNDTDELFYVMADDAIEAMEIAQQMFDLNIELLNACPATEEDMKEEPQQKFDVNIELLSKRPITKKSMKKE